MAESRPNEIVLKDDDKNILLGHPLGVSRIIKGRYQPFEDPITHEIRMVGDGTVMYDRTEARKRPYIVIAFENGDRPDE